MNTTSTVRFCEKQNSLNSKKGRLFIISAPSGAGKTTLCKLVLSHFPDIIFSISYTTRSPRSKEANGADYYFISQDDFKDKIKEGKWLEWAKVYGNYYGTLAEFVKKNLALGKDMLFDVDVQGTIQILDQYPDSVTIFIMPPSLAALELRLKSRGSDSKKVIAGRLVNAKKEMEQKDLYQHVIINDRLPEAAQKLISIIKQHRSQR